MAEQFGDKTQEATPHRRQKVREEGQVARSQDLASALLLVGATLMLMYFGQGVFRFFGPFAPSDNWAGEAWLQADAHMISVEWNAVLLQLARVLLPIFGACCCWPSSCTWSRSDSCFCPRNSLPTSVASIR